MSLHHFSPATGRPIDELLAGYAAGRLSPPLHGLVAAHLSIKPDNRPFVAALEGLIGEEIEAMPAAPVRDREARLAAIFDAVEMPKPAPLEPCAVIPGPLLRMMGCNLAGVPWRTKLPGVREYRLNTPGETEASLMWIKPGRTMPSHTHEGSEYTLVLQGGFTDATGHYRRGDIAIADSEVDHRPRADEDEDCVCFAVTDAPLRLTGRVGRIVQRFLGH
ncbi:ChrR family anti-sigma-E factor [Alsobacter sp. R-9]